MPKVLELNTLYLVLPSSILTSIPSSVPHLPVGRLVITFATSRPGADEVITGLSSAPFSFSLTIAAVVVASGYLTAALWLVTARAWGVYLVA